MLEYTVEQLKNAVAGLTVESVKENVPGYLDVKFCYLGQHVVMVSVRKDTQQVNNYWWQVNPIDCSECREFLLAQYAANNRIGKMALDACNLDTMRACTSQPELNLMNLARNPALYNIINDI